MPEQAVQPVAGPTMTPTPPQPGPFDSIRARYASDATVNAFHCLLLGRSGAGKTTMLRTCRKPVVIHQFDPNGASGLAAEIATGSIMVERFDQEDPSNPTAFSNWTRRMEEAFASGFFNHVGTLAIDSWTWLTEAYSNHIIAKNVTKSARSKDAPVLQLQDYQVLLVMLPNLIKRMQTLTCDLIITAHLDRDVDPVTGKLETSIAVFKSMKNKLPTLFNEVYVLDPRRTSTGAVYEVVTQPDGTYYAKTALGRDKLGTREPADFEAIRAKADRPAIDLKY